MRLFELISPTADLVENFDQIINQASEEVVNYYDANEMPYDYDLTFFNAHSDELEELGIDGPEYLSSDLDDPALRQDYDEEFRDWAESEVRSYYQSIEYWLKTHDFVYREIIASPDWLKDVCKQSLGIYWSMNEGTAHQWGDPKNGSIYFKITARIPKQGIDMAQTLAQNAIPDYTHEEEIRFFENVPLEIVNIEYQKDRFGPWKSADLDYPLTCKT